MPSSSIKHWCSSSTLAKWISTSDKRRTAHEPRGTTGYKNTTKITTIIVVTLSTVIKHNSGQTGVRFRQTAAACQYHFHGTRPNGRRTPCRFCELGRQEMVRKIGPLIATPLHPDKWRLTGASANKRNTHIQMAVAAVWLPCVVLCSFYRALIKWGYTLWGEAMLLTLWWIYG